MGHVGGPERAVYCAAKHALEGMTKAMALEWAPHGLRVNTLCPTFIRMPLAEPTLATPERRRWILAKIKLAQPAELADVMGPVVFLASDASRTAAAVQEILAVQENLDHQVDGIVTASVAMTNDLAALRGGGRARGRLQPRPRRPAPVGGDLGQRRGRPRRGRVPARGGAPPHRPYRRLAGPVHRARPPRRDLRRQRPHGLRRPRRAAPRPWPVGARRPVGDSYDDVPIAAWPAYGLATVRQPVDEMVAATVALPLAQVEDGAREPTKLRLPGPLVVRGSARRP
jgi:hypothetical protein